MVSVSSTGVQGNSRSNDSSLSADSRFVAFASGASNLVVGDTNNHYVIYVHDRDTGVTKRMMVPVRLWLKQAWVFRQVISLEN